MDLAKFLCIGGQKCGTSWLHNILEQHPNLSLPMAKETHFFEEKKRYSKGIDWYQSQFGPSWPFKMRGEVNPGYLWTAPPPKASNYICSPFREGIPERVAEALGSDLKLIIMLRHPVKRAVSAYVHHLSKGRLKRDEFTINDFNRMGIAHIGLYTEHIKHWMKSFSQENFQIYSFERVRENKTAFYKNVLEFLDVPDFITPPVDKKMQNFMEYEFCEDKSVRIIKSDPKYSDLTPGMVLLSTEDVEFLEKLYSDEVAKLEELTWKKAFLMRTPER